MKHEFTLPATHYEAWVQFADGDIANVTDGATSFDDVLDQATDAGCGEDLPFRMFRIDMDVETNTPETVSEVTDKAIAVIMERCEQRDLDIPEWMEAA